MPPIVAVVATLVVTATVTSTVVALALNMAIALGSYAYQRSQAKKAMRGLSAVDQTRTMNIREPAASWKLVVGQPRVGGAIVFIHQSGDKNKYTHVIIVHASHECDSFVADYLNNEAVTVDGGGEVTLPAKWAGKVRIKHHLGTDSQTVDTDLQADVTSGVWSNDHRLRGHCYTYLRYTTDSDVFSSGLPVYTTDLRGAKCYDPRDASTAWTRNPALQLRWYALLAKERGGYGADADELPDDWFSAQANTCDEDVDLAGGGTEKRYTSDGVLDTAVECGANADALAGAMGGTFDEANGAYRPRAAAYSSPEKDFGVDDIVSEIEIEPRDSARVAFNGVKGLYLAEINDWQPSDFPVVKNDTYMTEDGARIWHDMVLNFTTSSATAQRLAKIALERSRQDITVSAVFKLKAIDLIPGDTVTLTISRYGWSSKVFEVVEHELCSTGGGGADGAPAGLAVRMVLRETASGVFDWNDGMETETDLAPNTSLIDGDDIPTPVILDIEPAPLEEMTALPRIKITIEEPDDQRILTGGRTEFDYKKSWESTWINWSRVPGAVTVEYISDLEPGADYDVRVRFIRASGKSGPYCDPETIEAPDGQDQGLLVRNPDFTQGDVGWSYLAGEWELADDAGESGWGARMVAAGLAATRNLKRVRCKSGDRFNLHAHLIGVACHARVTFLDDTNTEIHYADTPNAGASWVFRDAYAVAPIGSAWCRAEVVGDDTDCQCDLVQMEAIPPGVAISDPATTVPAPQWEAEDIGGGDREITLVNDDPSATIKYRTGGSGAYSTYSAPFTVAAGTIVESYAERGGYTNSTAVRAVPP